MNVMNDEVMKEVSVRMATMITANVSERAHVLETGEYVSERVVNVSANVPAMMMTNVLETVAKQRETDVHSFAFQISQPYLNHSAAHLTRTKDQFSVFVILCDLMKGLVKITSALDNNK